MGRQIQTHFGKVSLEFNDYWKEKNRKVHGGVYSQGKRKTQRPFDSKKPLHLVLRSSKAKGKLSLLNACRRLKIKAHFDRFSERFGIKIYKFSNNGNHLHLIVKARHREDLQSFLRTVTGVTARLVLSAKRGDAKGKFWDTLIFSRISEWGQAFRNLNKYVIQNILEAAGVIPHQPRKYKLVKIESSA